MVKALLHIEGALLFLAALFLRFGPLGMPWWILPVLVLGPDLSMAGYLVNPRLGAVLYNSGHTLALALPVACAGYALTNGPLMVAGVVLAGHIGMDRALGFGLKYPSGFEGSHLQRV